MWMWIGMACVAISLTGILLLIFISIQSVWSVKTGRPKVFHPDSIMIGTNPSPGRLNLVLNRWGRVLLPFMTWEHRKRLDKTLMRAGMTDFDHHQFFFVQIVTSLLLMIVVFVILFLFRLDGGFLFQDMAYLIIAGVSGYFFPLNHIHAKARKRREEILRSLPFFMDMLALGLNAGMSLQSSLQLTLKHLDEGPLKLEWTRFLFDVRSGFTRAQALRQLSVRVDVSAVRQFVAALIQGESMGLSLTRTVLEYGKQLRTTRLLRAEKLAFQAPVKMLFPLAFFIFPCTFLILGFPVLIPVLGLN